MIFCEIERELKSHAITYDSIVEKANIKRPKCNANPLLTYNVWTSIAFDCQYYWLSKSNEKRRSPGTCKVTERTLT